MLKGQQWPAQIALERFEKQAVQAIRFDEKDYNSGDGFQTAIFGPVFWTSIHLVSFNYPVNPKDEDKERHRTWLHATGSVLPCRHCRDNFETNIKTASKPNDYDSRELFSRFCYRLHDEVNKMLGKKSSITYTELRRMYEGFRSRCLTESEKRSLSVAGKEFGCIRPIATGIKGKTVLTIVPRDMQTETFQVSEECTRACTREDVTA